MSTIFRQSHTLATASRYANPRNAGDILPVVYGVNWGVRGAGRWACPCIDTVNSYYLYSDCAVLSEAKGNVVQVYVDGVLQTSGYTFFDAGTDENGRTIAYIDFTSDPGESAVVTAQGSGKIDGSGLLIQHPLDIIADIVTAAGGSSADFDPAAWQREYAYATTNHLYAAGILTHSSRLVQEIIIEMLASFLATSFLTPDDTLVIQFPRYDFPQAEVQAFLHESEYLSISGERAPVVNATTWDITPTPNADILCLYPNMHAATVDCFPGVGAIGTVIFLSDICCLSHNGAGACYAWFLNADRQSVTYQSYGAGSANWVPVEYTELPNGSRKRLLWRNNSTGVATIWSLTAAYAYSSAVSHTEAGYLPYGYWHNGTEGRIVWCNTSGAYKLWTINASDAYVSYITYTAAGYTALSYQRTVNGRRRLAWRNNASGAIVLHRLNASDARIINVIIDAIPGYTPQHYWHNGLYGRITYVSGGTTIYRYVDANDGVTEWLPVANQTDYAYARNSQSKYGEQLRQFSGGWLQDITTPIPIQRALYAQYGDVPWIVTIATAQQDAFQLERGDLACWSWDRLRDENNLELVNQIGRVLEITRDPLQNMVTLKVLGTPAYYQSGGVRDRNRY